MSELNLGPAPAQNRTRAILISIAVLGLTAAAILYFNPRETADIVITKTAVYDARTSLRALPGAVHVIGTTAEDDLYVAVTLTLTDKLRLPLFIKDETAVLTQADGGTLEASAITPAELPNLLLTFPDLHTITGTPLVRDTQIAPSETAIGTILLHFPHTTEESWRARTSATLTLTFFHQSPATLTIP